MGGEIYFFLTVRIKSGVYAYVTGDTGVNRVENVGQSPPASLRDPLQLPKYRGTMPRQHQNH